MRRSSFALLGLFGLVGCGPSSDLVTSTSDAGACTALPSGFDEGDAVGHIDPYGARRAGQARAGLLSDASMIVQPAHGRQKIAVGDYVLANDKIAVVIEGVGLSDGYARFGGEILAIDKIGDDGRPLGLSNYLETLMALSVEMVEPSVVSVVNDGSDGGPAVVRAAGKLLPIPFLDGALSALFPRRYGYPAAYEYVLEPGSEKLLVRIGLINQKPNRFELKFGAASDEMHGFFQFSTNQLATPERGFAKPSGNTDWVGFVSGDWNFAWRRAGALPLTYGATISGFQYFSGPGFSVEGCSVSLTDHAEVIAGGPDYDGLREAIRTVDGAAPWRSVSGIVTHGDGGRGARAWVHALSQTGQYLTRTHADTDGSFMVHVPAGEAVSLIAQEKGLPPSSPVEIGTETASATLTLPTSGKLSILARDAATNEPIPVRIQVVPSAAFMATPAEFGFLDELEGRLYQEFAISGSAELTVPPGDHRVIVTRGTEWELFDETVSVASGQTLSVPVLLEQSVKSTGYLCADFHIHTQMSADSNDPVVHKVKGAVADGLEIPVSSEHEWVVDFQPIIQELGLEPWAFSLPSEELTTFTWGHFGVVPLFPRPEELNNGAVEWIGLKPPEIFSRVRTLPEAPVLIVNHPRSGGFMAYFSAASFDRDAAKGRDAELWSNDFDAVEVFNGSDFESNRDASVADWFALLNAGMTMWAVGNSDSHFLRSTPVGYPRTCLFFGHDDPRQLTPNTVRNALASGASTISGGLFMTVSGPAGERPGQTIVAPSGSAELTVTVEAPSWVDASVLETIVNGALIRSEPLRPLGDGAGKRFVHAVRVEFDTTKPRNWVVFHARGDADLSPLYPGRKPFAVSNPVFLQP